MPAGAATVPGFRARDVTAVGLERRAGDRQAEDAAVLRVAGVVAVPGGHPGLGPAGGHADVVPGPGAACRGLERDLSLADLEQLAALLTSGGDAAQLGGCAARPPGSPPARRSPPGGRKSPPSPRPPRTPCSPWSGSAGRRTLSWLARREKENHTPGGGLHARRHRKSPARRLFTFETPTATIGNRFRSADRERIAA
jgi:hypothetical protein